MSQHALLSPSGFQALMLCPAKPAMERGRPDQSSEYADEGTAAHYLASECLRGVIDEPTVGDVIVVHADGSCDWLEEMPQQVPAGARCFTVDTDFAEHVSTYVRTVRDYAGEDGELFVEQSLPIDHITSEDGAEGTGDAIILRGDELIVIDLKFGRGVEVSAEDNPQLKLYALGALRKFDLVGDIKRVRTVICQPRVSSAPSEVDYPAVDLMVWGADKAAHAAAHAMDLYRCDDQAVVIANCKPHEDACRFCKAKGDCPALDGFVSQAMGREFTDLTTEDQPERDAIAAASVAEAKAAGELGAKLSAAPLVEIWLKGIRAEGERELLAGRQVEGFKLVAGKKGARAWADEADAEKALKAMRLKKEQMYSFSVISPTTAEKLLKPTPKRWAKLQPLITQNDGKPSVAPMADKRPALEIKPIESEFTPITESSTADDLV